MFKIGCDPELFLKNKEGKLVSAIGKFGGTKLSPRPILEQIKKGFAIQEDNVLLEYNIPAAKNFNEFTDYLSLAQGAIQHLIQPMNLEVADCASASMPPDEMMDDRAFEFGCDPDWDAWNLKINPKPTHPDVLFRSAGGHIHIGHKMTRTTAINIVRCLDRFVGIWLAYKDPDKHRQELYGKPGCMRFKPYGLEYRTPSNWWTFQSNDTIAELYARVKSAIDYGLRDNDYLIREKFTLDAFKDQESIAKWAKAF